MLMFSDIESIICLSVYCEPLYKSRGGRSFKWKIILQGTQGHKLMNDLSDEKFPDRKEWVIIFFIYVNIMT